MILELEHTQDEFIFRRKYRDFLQQDVLLDVEPLLLYLLGIYDNKNDGKLLEMYGYTREHYLLLLQLIELLKKTPANLVVTPHVLFSAIRHIHYDCEKKFCNNDYCRIILSKIYNDIKSDLKEMREVPADKNKIISHTNFLGKWKLHSISLDIVDKTKNNCRIILTRNSLIKERFRKSQNILVIPLREFSLNASFLTE